MKKSVIGRFENQKRNKKFLDEFTLSLRDRGLVDKAVEKHYFNVEFYIEDFLNYYEVTPAEEGCTEIEHFLSDWFVRKAMWSSPESVKENISSLKKFYKFMHENGHTKAKDYELLLETIKENKDAWIENVEFM